MDFIKSTLDDPEKLMIYLSNMKDEELLSLRDKNGATALHVLCGNGIAPNNNKTCLQHVLERVPELSQIKDNEQHTPLLCVTKRSQLKVALYLLEANPSSALITTNDKVTPLHYLAQCGGSSKQEEMALLISTCRRLIECGVDINAEDINGLTPLHYAVKFASNYGHFANTQLIKFLIRTGAKLCSQSGVNALNIAARSFEAMKLLLKLDSSTVNIADKNNLTPLYHALKVSLSEDEPDVVQLLLDHGAEPVPDINCIDYARNQYCPFGMVKLLLERDQNYDVNSLDNSKQTLLQLYASSYENISMLINRGADPSICIGVYDDPLVFAVENCKVKHFESARMMIEAGADVTRGLADGHDNVLHSACKQYYYRPTRNLFKLIQYLIHLPQFQDPSLKIDIDRTYHPQTAILEHFHKLPRKTSTKILTWMIKSNIIALDYKVPALMNFKVNLNVMFDQRFLTPIGAVLNTSELPIMLSQNTKDLLKLMYSVGFKVGTECEDGVITPLTVLLAVHIPDQLDDDDENYTDIDEDDSEDEEDIELPETLSAERSESLLDDLMIMVETFIEQGVNVEDMSLDLLNPNDEYSSIHRDVLKTDKSLDHFKRMIGFEDLTPEAEIRNTFLNYAEALRRKLWLPDALWVAFLANNGRAVKRLLPYWSAPPLALLLFRYKFLDYMLLIWYPMLSKYGGVPHGTEVFTRLFQLISSRKPLRLQNGKTFWKHFQEMHSSPLSLRDLARYAVRASRAAEAKQHGVSLPGLLAQNCPPGLKDYLLMTTHV